MEPSAPVLTQLLAQEWLTQADKPTARGTKTRYSAAHDCERKMYYSATDTPKSNPENEGDVWASGIGRVLHEAAQEAISHVYSDAEFEVSSEIRGTSGSCDCLLSTASILTETGVVFPGTHVLWEYKTMGEYGFDKQVGFNRRSETIKNGSGPTLKAIAQVGMNALGIESERPGVDIQTVILGTVCTSALSKRKARKMQQRGFSRFGAEFRISRDIWEPLALAELERMDTINQMAQRKYMGRRIVIGDAGYEQDIDPEGKDWQCDYCPYLSQCLKDGPQ